MLQFLGARDRQAQTFRHYLSNPTASSLNIIKLIRNYAKGMSIGVHEESWETFINNIVHDTHGSQNLAYKEMKSLNNRENDRIRINNIDEEK